MKQIESFFWGIVAALGALFIQLVVYVAFSAFFSSGEQISFDLIYTVPSVIIAFAFIEEIFKYIIISKRIESYSFERTFVVNAFMVGAGFAATEFLLFLSVGNLPDKRILAELATIHIGTAGIMGYMVALKNPNKISTLLQIVVFTTFLHSIYNILITKREFVQNYLIIFLLGFIVFYNLLGLARIKSKLAQE